MARYIDADKLLDDIGLRKGITANEVINGVPDKGIRPMDAPHCWFILSVMYAPTEDVRENVKGEWIRRTKVEDVYSIDGIKTWGIKCQCNRCTFTTIVIEDFGYYRYCPNCGADMRTRLQGTEIDGMYIDISGDGTVIEQI